MPKGICIPCGIMTDFLYRLQNGEEVFACSTAHAARMGAIGGGEESSPPMIDLNPFDDKLFERNMERALTLDLLVQEERGDL